MTQTRIPPSHTPEGRARAVARRRVERHRLAAIRKAQKVLSYRAWKSITARVRIDPLTGCWEHGSSPYPKMQWNGKAICRTHAMYEEIHHRPVPAGMFICHRCDNPLCIAPYHLFLGTPADNRSDMCAKGRERPARGAAVNTAKLTPVDILNIRRRRMAGETLDSLAASFSVNPTTIRRAALALNWRHVS
jgi:hypothetical protein